MSWNAGYNYCLLQRGNGYYEDSEDSQSSQETNSSQSSQETDSSQEVTEHLSTSSLQKRTEKSTVRVSAVDASDEKRLHLPKGDGNTKTSQRYRWL